MEQRDANGYATSGKGALAGIRVIEFAGVGAAPFTGMMLADHGAEVICITRFTPAYSGDPAKTVLNRSRHTIAFDLKKPEAIAMVKDIASSCDALIEGFRPGVMERLGLGPETLQALNPKLVYGRLTSWGQTGPLAKLAGHDINAISLSGMLYASRHTGQKPTPPVNALGDFGGGGMLLAFGIVAGILAARSSGRGQVIDASMTEGAALFTSMMCGHRAQGRWDGEPGTNFLDTGAPFYNTYETKDGRFIAVGAIEAEFYAEMLRGFGLTDDPVFKHQFDKSHWPEAKEKLTLIVLTRSLAEWSEVFQARDACFSQVVSLDEAAQHPHNRARGTFIDVDGVLQPAPAPRFAQSGTVAPRMPITDGRNEESLLQSLGYDHARIQQLKASGALRNSGEKNGDIATGSMPSCSDVGAR